MEPTTGKAKYYTLMEALKEQILSGTIKPGQKLPSENELTREYALSERPSLFSKMKAISPPSTAKEPSAPSA
jgi:DNA-binding FadR family transcriptional regulator